MNVPASRGSFQLRFASFDVLWAAASPIIALYLRNVNIEQGIGAVALYCLSSFTLSLIAFLIFRIRDGIARHFSVTDALDVAKAVVVSEFVTTVVLFSTVRLEGIPRTVPIIHALILATGLIAYRAAVRLRHDSQPQLVRSSHDPHEHIIEHIIIIGGTRLSLLYMKIMNAYAAQRYKILGILDANPAMIGRSLEGARVLGQPSQLESFIREFVEHGITVDRIIVGGDRDTIAESEMIEIERVCAARSLKIDFVPTLVGITTIGTPAPLKTASRPAANYQLSSYLGFKRVEDVVFAFVLCIIFAPVMLLVAVVVLFDVGSPILFWQRRIGVDGKPFLLYKFRTLKPLFSGQGLPIGTSDRTSFIGNLVRRFRLDELPQLLSVLVGDMSLVGPRPLLPRDQPPASELRLMVRPGITGWAQVNGGKSISVEKKKELDEWYIRHASFWLDLRILLKTIAFMVRGERPTAELASAEDPGTCADQQANP
jgi:lipopolysaccharide/colanic/teichoic acid biosynthesis glycosyltransferase